MKGLWKLTWLEIKIFLREPLGVFGLMLPVVLFALFGRAFGGRMRGAAPAVPPEIAADLPIFAALLIALSTVLSLITIVSIYREGGILKRLRATPLRPHTILTAHVLVKLLMTAVTLALLVAAGKRYYPVGLEFPVVSFAIALLLSTVAILSVGFLAASLVPTARFAQPIGAAIFYPMVALSGLLFPIGSLSPPLQALARLMPLTYAVSLLRGILRGDPWSAHLV